MTSQPFSESSQALDGLGVTYGELLFYQQRHLIGKQVCPSDVLSMSRMLNLHGSFCLEQLWYFSMVRRHSCPLILIYSQKDYIVTFEDEVNFIWRAAPRLSMAKLLFFLVGCVTFEW